LGAILDAWKHGDVAEAADRSGQTGQQLENNLGIALAQSDPALAVVWANELADAAGRTTILAAAAIALLKSDPVVAQALGQQVAESDRASFYQALFSAWAAYNTQAALDAAAALDDAALRDAALQTIHSVAPVGIGAALGLDNGYPVVTQLMPGAAADLSGQLAVGDHIIAVGQGDGEFENVQGMSLQEIVGAVRGPPGSVVELAIIPADDPDSEPQYIVIQRGQILFQP
jgi:C-terminal processing protease CtpA/Prc